MPDCQTHANKSECEGEIWECPGCGLSVCAAYGASDNEPDICDACWYAKHKGLVPVPECV